MRPQDVGKEVASLDLLPGARYELPRRVEAPRFNLWRQGEFIDSRKYESCSDEWKQEQMMRELCRVYVDTGGEGIEGMGDFRGHFDSIVAVSAAVEEHNRAVHAARDTQELLFRLATMFPEEEIAEPLRGEVAKALRDIE